jgi:hypothetical protein
MQNVTSLPVIVHQQWQRWSPGFCCEVLEVQETFTGTTCSSGQHETSTAMDQTKDSRRRKGAPVHAILT